MEDDSQHNDTEKKALPSLEAAVSRPLACVSDEIRLAQLGHAQELNRGFSPLALASLVLCLMATWEALSTVISSALISGGPPCLFYNYILALAGSMAIVLSLAEIASIYPTAGAQYHWTAMLAPSKVRATMSWAVGWISLGGQIVLTASAAFAAGLQFQSLIVITHEDYDRPRWQGMLFYWAVVAYAAVINVFGVKTLPNVNLVAGVLHITGWIAIMVTLGVLGTKNAPDFVFTQVVNSSGWSNDEVSWLVGLQSAVYPLLGYDAACHLAEELPHASKNVPLAMIGGTALNGVLGFGYAIMLLFVTSPLETLLSTPTGFPFMQIFLDVTQSPAGTIVMSLIPCFIATAGAVAGTASASRTLWAFARDGGLPWSGYFSLVQPGLQVPIRAVMAVFVLQLLLGLLYLGNVTAFNAVLSLAIICSYLPHVMPIYYMIVRGRPGALDRAHYGAFRLSRPAGYALNVVALMWITLVVVFSLFPLSLPVVPDNMNYSSVVLVGWMFFGFGYYYLGRGKAHYKVPCNDDADEDEG